MKAWMQLYSPGNDKHYLSLVEIANFEGDRGVMKPLVHLLEDEEKGKFVIYRIEENVYAYFEHGDLMEVILDLSKLYNCVYQSEGK